MRKLRRLTEAEVIAEFLRGEFFQKEYDATVSALLRWWKIPT